ncbi:MAG: hypothetical protein KGZ25_14235, partial [Planctomycetes bacterium]|nr:hypothetical protein [Planctomycetota bacterium]
TVFNHFRRPGDENPHVTMGRLYNELGIDLCRGYCTPQTPEERNEAQTHWPRKDVQSPADLQEELNTPANDSWAELKPQLLGHYRWMRDNLSPRTMFVPSGGTGLTDLYTSAGFQPFCEWCKDYPGLIRSVLGKRARENAKWAQTVAQERLCPLFFLGEDIGGKNSLLFSPEWLRQNFFPNLALNIEPLATANIKVIFHSDGYIMEILDDLVEMGIAGLNPIEPIAGMDIKYLKKRYGERLILVGNVDSSHTLVRKKPRDVRRAVKDCIRAASPAGGHFIASSSEITPTTPLKNIFAFYEACHTFGQYPIDL